ncbi:hypothetical protein F503_04935 [Ophiostoma piceae UAMH 11346]|uniref:Uncharacterized protein n=1 Tax=Ophiostoma piceae (strain UAMH 11346) TaxID=1262450 RepID=S3BUC2_OPHP1|nr:hypothetical protein F503_04935 [Ophiostoma piceae UAMH 11346]
MQTYNAEGTSPFPNYGSHHRRNSSLDDNDKFTNHCNGALAKIRLTYIRLLALDKLESNREVVRRRNSKVTPIHELGKPAQFRKRTITRTVSF